MHHTQLLNRLVREGKLTPVKEGEGAHKRSITYHDPCYIGRHNGVYAPPRELLEVLPGASYVEMERNSERSFCCGAGGARMWMEETIGTRINNARTAEAVGTGADQIAVGCPFCRVMLDDGLTAAQAEGNAREEVEVLDVAQMLLASVKGTVATRRKPGEGGETPAPAAKASPAEPGGGDETSDETTVKKTADVGAAAKASEEAGEEPARPASSGGSLFDVGGDDDKTEGTKAGKEEEPAPEPEPEPEKAESKPASSGGSLFDIKSDEPDTKAEKKTESEEAAEPETDKKAEESKAEEKDGSSALGSATSLFDIKAESKAESTTESTAESKPEKKAEPEPEPEAKDEPKDEAPVAASSSSEGGSLFDIAAPEAQASEPEPKPEAETETEPEPEPEPEAQDEPDDEPEPEAQDEPDDEPEPEAQDEPDDDATGDEKPKPASSGEAHQPKTDTDIGGASSLFDL